MKTMKVYLLNSRQGSFRMHIQPGAEYKEVAEWKDEAGIPLYMTIPFIDGVAKVTSSVGRYLIDKGLAKASPPSPLILPPDIQYASA